MSASRRVFMRSALAMGTAIVGLKALGACAAPARLGLSPDPAGTLDLPEGFSYTILSRTGDAMSDGLFEPAAHDGMAAFPVAGDADRCLLVRNHELGPGQNGQGGAFGPNFRDVGKVDPTRIYDRSEDGPHLGGTTTLLVNMRTLRVERSHLSLAGTLRNCAGGPTPWGSWLSCEETLTRAGDRAQKAHGFVFEAPAAERGLSSGLPLTDMGRFVHEAAAVDPATGVVYLTEDEGEGLFYRFLPNAPGELHKGGRLQALRIRERPRAHTRNAGGDLIAAGEKLLADWVDLDGVLNEDGALAQRGHAKGAAYFARGEGLAHAIENGRSVIYFTATSGGAAGKGQIFRYAPGRFEGRPEERAEPGTLELFVESRGEGHFDYPDNLTAAPWGDLLVCEDGSNGNWLRGVTASGRVYPIARNAMNQSEFAGVTVSPDGSTVFVNIQNPGLTLAIRGPWRDLSRTARTSPSEV
jgi:uncharacterized protein